jgi:hypothetical protein
MVEIVGDVEKLDIGKANNEDCGSRAKKYPQRNQQRGEAHYPHERVQYLDWRNGCPVCSHEFEMKVWFYKKCFYPAAIHETDRGVEPDEAIKYAKYS